MKRKRLGDLLKEVISMRNWLKINIEVSRSRKYICNTYDNYHKNMSGWIFIESLIGIVIVSVALTAIVLSYTQLTKTTVYTTNRTQATYIAQQTIENFKFNDGKTVGTAANGKIYPDFSLESTSVNPDNGITYSIEIKQNLPYTSLDNTTIYPIQTIVTWKDASSSNINSVNLISYYYLIPQS
ncbi:MAG: hypothetical protein H6Q68_2021 [Firmicutes bacterium]|nr:hypothetical protein [Bacillota bacterium]